MIKRILQQFQAGIRFWLLGLAMLASLPLFVFAVYSTYRFSEAQQEEITAELIQRTEATAHAVGQRLSTVRGYLNGLATSDAARRNNLAELYAHAKRLVDASPEAAAISLVGPDGGLVFLTLRPFGTERTQAGDPESARRVFATGKPVASGPFPSPVSDRIVTTVGVPLFLDGKVAYCLRMVLRSDSLNELLAQQYLPADWTSGIVDRHGLLLARSRATEQFVGKAASPSILNALRAGTPDIFDSVTRDGVPSRTLIVQVPAWDWSVVVSVPVASLNASKNRALGLLIAIGLVLALVCIAAAHGLARYIARQVAGAAAASAALHRGEQPLVPNTPIKELGDMAQAIGAVRKREERTQLALLNMAARNEDIHSQLASAKRDALTGLPTRALFLEMVAGLCDAVAARGGRQLALLFIDLDGFKAINDARGHDQGDQVLMHTAEILRALTRESDAAGRLGGDEFVVCLTAAEGHIATTAASVAARVVDRVRAIGFGVGCSIGIAVCPVQCPDLLCALRRADEAMYEAKRRGKNGFVIFGAEPKTDGSAWTEAAPPACNIACVS